MAPRITHLHAIVALGLVVRLAVALVYPEELTDSREYRELGHNVLQHGVFTRFPIPDAGPEHAPRLDPEILRTPAYPLFLAGIEATLGRSLKAVTIVQAFLGTLNIWLIVLIASRFVARPIALSSGLLLAIHPLAITFCRFPMTETVFNSLLLGAALLVLRMEDGEERLFPRRAVAVGLTLGLLALVRSQGVIFLALFGVVHWIRQPSTVSLRRWAVVLATAAIVFIPWTVRNAEVIGHPTPFGVGLWQNLWQASIPYEIGNEWDTTALVSPEAQAALGQANPDELDGVFRSMAIDQVKSDPTGTLLQRLRRYPYTWINSTFYLPSPVIGEASRSLSDLAANAHWGWFFVKIGALGLFCVLPVALVPWGLMGLSARDGIFLVTVPATVAAVHFFLGICEYRYSLPALPFLAVLSAVALHGCPRVGPGVERLLYRR